MQNEYPLYVANQPEQINHDLEVRDKYSGEVVTKVAMADQETIERAISAAVEATKPDSSTLRQAL